MTYQEEDFLQFSGLQHFKFCRVTVELTEALRQEVRTMTAEMHRLYDRGYTPKVKPTKGCHLDAMRKNSPTVAPHMGAWIEIPTAGWRSHGRTVAPRTGGVD